MKKMNKVSKVLLMATALSTATVMSSAVVPAVADLAGIEASAQSNPPLASQARADAATAARANRPKIRSTTGIGERAGKFLKKVQEIASGENPDYQEILNILEGERMDRLNPAEQLSVHQFMAMAKSNMGNLSSALVNFKAILEMDTISNTMRDQVTFNVGQIEFSEGNYDVALQYLYEWLQYQPTPSITQIVTFANLHYTIGISDGIAKADAESNFRTAAEFLHWAIDKSKAEGKEDKEEWYGILRAIYNSLEDIDKAVEYTELLAVRWPKKDYWTQLSGLYAQKASAEGLTEEQAFEYEKRQMVAFELLYRQGLLESGRELESMAQLYLYHEAAYQSTKVMKNSLDAGTSEENFKNLNLLSIGLLNSKDYEDSVEPLRKTAELADDGNMYIQLANILLNLDRYEEATAAIDMGIEKGGVRREDQSRLLQGQAYLSLEMFDKARESFREAAKDDRSRRNANQLLRYTDAEEKRINDIKEYLS
ncbi:hypothetical protein [Pseudemcibacter aquimaris]|uniref:hypothetical protein n=1 Tax=Pseudemcibacter aquimaris TaxID=2857064 RepID=UPI0020124DF2|nr:hypothetical protein [Pseudemcibacter aquimaris]MCC3862284.1 hypothetical protein [Pseudemcibacter aquimaris]WDU59034.1 hypothetical protein KW060_01955 [Pseudemcibacter aquimaris]